MKTKDSDEDVLTRRYDTVYSNEYYVDYGFMVDHVEELILLKDIVIPCSIPPLPKVRKLISKRMDEDWETYGIYRWEEMYSKEVPRSIDEMREDDVRLALDIAKKYPEYSDIICRREVEENFRDFPNDLNKSAEEWLKPWLKKLETVTDMIDMVYSNLINEELIYLDDFVPEEFLSDYAFKKRYKWLTENGKVNILERNYAYNMERYKIDDLNERLLNIMFELDEFIEKYPQYSQLIPDYDAFVKYGDKLCEKVP